MSPANDPIDARASSQFLFAVDEMMHFADVSVRRRKGQQFARVVDHLWPHGYPARILHVVGTNGKGTTTKYAEATLMTAGLRVGTITSPHVVDVRERWSVDQSMIDARLLSNAWDRIAVPALDHFGFDFGFHDLCLLVGLIALAECRVDIAVIEAGIGGAYDRTACLARDAVIITNVGNDHRSVLGPHHWLREINKARAAVAGRPLILGEHLDPTIWEHLSPAPVVSVVRPRSEALHDPSMPGSVRPHLVDLALEAVSAMGIEFDRDAAISAISAVRLPGRWQFLDDACVVDMAHDAHAVGALVTMLDGLESPWHRAGDEMGGATVLDGGTAGTAGTADVAAWTAVIAVSEDRDPREVFAPLLPRCSEVVITKAADDGADPEVIRVSLSASWPQVMFTVETDPMAALVRARRSNRPVVVCGSSRLAGAVIAPLDPRLRELDQSYGWRRPMSSHRR